MNNISAVRYILAFSVIIAHVGELMGFTNAFVFLHWPIPSYAAVGGFFALSGYLVYGSYERHPVLIDYLRRRARRILPPYVKVVILSAIGLSAISSLPWMDYFTSPEWWRYVVANLSFLNFLAPSLPGVFEGHLHTAVNGSLWTMKIEVMLYLTIPLAVWLCTRLNCKTSRMAIIVYALSVGYRLLFTWLYIRTGQEIYAILSRQFFGQLAFFFTGVWLYASYQTFQRYRHSIALVALSLFLFSAYIPYYSIVFEPVVISLLTLYACIVGRWGSWIPVKNNVSYEMYLIHFPLIQLGIHFGLPALGYLPCLLIITAISALSAYLIKIPDSVTHNS